MTYTHDIQSFLFCANIYFHLIRSKQFLSNRAYSADFYEPCAYIYIFTPACDTLLRLSLPVSINGGPFPFSLPGWHSAK